MSNHIISLAYKRDLKTAMRKSVMVLLADKASDDGSGIYASKQTMADELCCSKQTVIDTIKGFITEGLVQEIGHRRNDNGYTVEYGINVEALEAVALVNCHANRQSKRMTGQSAGPVKSADVTSQPAGPKPSMNPLSSEAKASSDKRAKPGKFEFSCPEGVDQMDWSALIDNRKAKRAALSEGAHRQIITKLESWSRAGWPPGPIVAHAAERGWTTVFETDEMKGPRNGSGSRTVQRTPDGRSMGRTEAAGLGAYEKLAASGNFRTGGQTGPALPGGNHSGPVALPNPNRPHRHVAGR